MRKLIFAYAKTKAQISFEVTAKLISAFVFAERIVQYLFFLNPKFPASSHLCLYRSVCVKLFRNHIVGFLMTRLISIGPIINLIMAITATVKLICAFVFTT